MSKETFAAPRKFPQRAFVGGYVALEIATAFGLLAKTEARGNKSFLLERILSDGVMHRRKQKGPKK